MRKIILLLPLISFLFCSCKEEAPMDKKQFTLITLDPGHFHAALVQKSMLDGVDSTVYVYGPSGNDLDMHLNRIKNYNSRPDLPTHWNEIVYNQPDYLEKMISDKKGNVVVISGNNRIKADYIYKSLEAGLNVFGDKPMIIRYNDFGKLKASFELAKQKNVLLYDIMTERYEMATHLQKVFSMNPEIFGTLVDGTSKEPAITIESIHHFYKYVSGSVLVRPQWFLDVDQQGEGIVDVMTHLADLVQWECFPNQIIDTSDINIREAKRWPTALSYNQFYTITKSTEVPPFLKKNIVGDSILQVFSNGEINYSIKGKHARIISIWNYQAPEGGADTHYCMMRGTASNLIIRQGIPEKYIPTLYIEPAPGKMDSIKMAIDNQMKIVEKELPGLAIETVGNQIKLVIPPVLQEGHEAHFAQVMKKFLGYLEHHDMPSWEVPNMISKYYTTTKALDMAITSTGK
ncbi:MAG: putative oxidoreductase C-terminal domain-containing protein [Saprospiraceae bacterium]